MDGSLPALRGYRAALGTSSTTFQILKDRRIEILVMLIDDMFLDHYHWHYRL
jgi:hypothetical protein